MKIAIVGFARDGQAAYQYWRSDKHQITVCDQDTTIDLPTDVHSQLGQDYLKNLDKFDLIVRTAGLPPSMIADANGQDILDKVTTITNEFFRVCPTKNIIGVTGTKGKGTTCTLIAKMLEGAGLRVHLGGNIGIPALDLLKNNIASSDWVVLEQSSFQLIDQKYSPHLAICLMVVPEHLNWHQDEDEYLTAKQGLFRRQTANDVAIYHPSNVRSQQVVSVSRAKKIPYLAPPGALVDAGQIKIDNKVICRLDELKILGQHNQENVCAAITAVWQIVPNALAIKKVLSTFSGLEHRLEFVREFDGVKYYDDSFGTTPETAIVALQAFVQPKVMILGGSDKGADYNELAKQIASSNVRSVILIGVTGSAIAAALAQRGFNSVVNGGKDMPSIVAAAHQQAQNGDVVLLSTACASFGLFKDYKDRGQQFKQAVAALV